MTFLASNLDHLRRPLPPHKPDFLRHLIYGGLAGTVGWILLFAYGGFATPIFITFLLFGPLAPLLGPFFGVLIAFIVYLRRLHPGRAPGQLLLLPLAVGAVILLAFAFATFLFVVLAE